MNASIISNMQKRNENLSKYACKDSEAIRFYPMEDDIRQPFFRDIDKILYTLSYLRYVDKTQVFSFNDNDMISTRIIHIQLVSKIARTIGRGLNLNEDLIEAASLGHDLGHTPFGHVGESVLSKLSKENGEGYFNHNVQSVRTLMNIEKGGNGTNITLQVLDAILCHNGEELKQKYVPMKKTKEEFLREYSDTYINKNALKGISSMTLEGCVVRISDVIAYVGKDLEDAIRLKIIDSSDLPKEVADTLGTSNSDIVNTIILDILENSINKNYIMMSDKVYSALQQLIDYNYKNIYLKANTKEQLSRIDNMFNDLFKLYKYQIDNNMYNEDIYMVFLNEMSKYYCDNTTTERKIIDYIAGMTDNYIIRQYDKYFNNNLKKHAKEKNRH